MTKALPFFLAGGRRSEVRGYSQAEGSEEDGRSVEAK